jgi:two-component system chemotaxis response regulator CheY
MATVLIVDDSSMSRRILRNIVESAGHTVVEASDGLTGLEQYFLQKPDVVLLDLIMTGMFGLDVLKKIREMDAQARVIVATADIQASTRTMTEAEGAAGYITKPFAADEVHNAISRALKEL